MLFLRWKRDTNAPPWILIGFAAATLSIGIFRPGTDTIQREKKAECGGGHNHPVTVIAPSYQRSAPSDSNCQSIHFYNIVSVMGGFTKVPGHTLRH